MDIVGGKYACACGETFEWKTFFLECGEYVAFEWQEVQVNVVNKQKSYDRYIIEIQCPKCYKREFVEKMPERENLI